MKTLQAYVVAVVVWFCVVRTLDAQTTLVVHHNANLRAGHSTQSAMKGHLEPGDELTTEEPNKTEGFWHVHTTEGVVGWIYQTLAHVAEQDAVPTAPTPDRASGYHRSDVGQASSDRFAIRRAAGDDGVSSGRGIGR